MIERGESILNYTPDYKLKKQDISGGHHTVPSKGFFVDSTVYELDVKGMYPTIVLNTNLSFDTLNCICCKDDPTAQFHKDTIKIINENLKENKINRVVTKYWVCQRRKGAFPAVLQQVISEREKYLESAEEGKRKTIVKSILIEEYQTHQIGAKLFANSGFGLFANEHFEFSNYKVAECITGEGRRIHKSMELLANAGTF